MALEALTGNSNTQPPKPFPSNPRAVGCAISIIVSTSVLLATSVYLGQRCFSILSSTPECPTLIPCECDTALRFFMAGSLGLAGATVILLQNCGKVDVDAL